MSDLDLDELRSELEDFAQPQKAGGRSPREERIIAGFEEIQRFVETHGRAPQHGEDRDIFERLYAVVNAGANLQRLAGAKVQHSGKQEGPRYRGPSCLLKFIPEERRPMAVRAWADVLGACFGRA